MTERAWRIIGRVQGVGFRWWSVKTAVGLGIVGRVWNESDGSVVLHARGADEALVRLEDRLRVGPLMARVDRLESIPPLAPWPEVGMEIEG